MKKVLKIFAWGMLGIVVVTGGFALYLYQTNDFVRAVVENDESRLFYFPVTEMRGMDSTRHEEIPLQVADGVTIYSYFFQPPTDSAKATIFFLHGSGGNVSLYLPAIRPLVEGGFQVYALDWRGFGKSGGKPTHTNVLNDSKTAFANMLSREDVQSKPVVVFGQSLGGQVAVRLTKDLEEQVAALVLDGSVASFPTVAADNAPVDFLRQRAESHPEEFHQPYIAAEDIREISATPKLIIQSSDDSNVRPERGQTLFANAREPKAFWQTEGRHIHTLMNYPHEAVQRIERLLNWH
ncbi:alpha/beta hydrolase [Microbulbifer yueqingensis]|uniref:Serine aminopeptidase S33 domain-containing protein n=1 Tax=Microbulbifer yueqingensis TaxID=658219 RepID=A0A1G8XP87_9GAMM|nr:alpha/beta fold hydrolase [Microbulbifer yueqingensis]SDJ92419.1 hypothetical protein SAMN05216212_1186 [Microbulbifer yueqingensis]